jgi:hypothetical protein
MTLRRRSFSRRRRRLLVALTVTLALAGVLSSPASANVGVQDGSFNGTTAPTGQKPQSKLWYTSDGTWWAMMFSSTAGRWDIFRLDRAANRWVDTGTPGDDRRLTSPDVLWEGGHLYVASAGPGLAGRAYRYSYDAAAKSWSSDGMLAADVTNAAGVEALVLARDGAGHLWVTFTQGNQVWVAHSTTGESAWTAPYVIPGTGTLDPDDISSIIAYGPGRIGVLYSNQSAAGGGMYFATHADGAAEDAWSSETVVAGAELADDHINLKTHNGAVYAALKTSLNSPGDPLEVLWVRGAGGGWSSTVFGRVSDDHSRSIVELDPTDGRLYMLGVSPCCNGGTVHYKAASLSSPSFAAGAGTPFLESTVNARLNNPSSTKQSLSPASGLVVLAGDDQTKTYMHAAIDLGGQDTTGPPDTTIDTGPPSSTPVQSAAFTFSASEPESGFECSLDGGAFAACLPGQTYTGLGLGSHTFQARAIDAAGHPDPTPAQQTWTVASAAPKTYDVLADAFADEANPTTGLGTRTYLAIDGDLGAAKEAYVRFDASSFQGPAQQAALRVFATKGSAKGADVYATGTSWSEGSLTWANRPARGAKLASAVPVADGAFVDYDVSSGVPGPGSYGFDLASDSTIEMRLAAREGASNVAQLVLVPDTTPPHATISDGPSGTVGDGRATFAFTASEAGASFQCQLDGGAWQPCTSPKGYVGLTDGAHSFSVRALDPAGNIDPAPATRTWTVATPPPAVGVDANPVGSGSPGPGSPSPVLGSSLPAGFGASTRVTARVARRGLRPARSGLLSLRVLNGNAFAVSGRATLDATIKGRRARRSARVRVASLRYFTIAGERAATLELRLSHRGRALVRHRALRVRLTLRLRDPAGHLRIVRVSFRLLPPRR